MPATSLVRTVATAVCGAWLCAALIQSAGAGEQVKTIKLRAGEVQLVNNDEQRPKAVINGKEFLFEPEYVGHKETIRLSDRDVIILTSDRGKYSKPKYRVFSLRLDGRAEEIDELTSRTNGTLVVAKKGDAIHFDLGYYNGLKVDAELSPQGVEVSRKPMTHPAFDQKDCKWMYEKVLESCINKLGATCDFTKIPYRAALALNEFQHHPRWKIAEDRFEGTCEAACKTKKRPAYGQFAKNICGP